MTVVKRAVNRVACLAAILTAAGGAVAYVAALEARAYITHRPEPTLADRVQRAIRLEQRRRRT